MNESDGLEKNIRAFTVSVRQLSMRAKKMKDRPADRLDYIQTCLAIKVIKKRIHILQKRLKELGGVHATVQE